MTDIDFMRIAIDECEAGIAAGQIPVAAILVRGDAVVFRAHNAVWEETDPTAHAEMTLIRRFAKQAGTIDLSGHTLYCTCEPCPMCLGAIHWSRVDRVVYGAQIEDAARAGFSELLFPAKELARQAQSRLVVDGSVLREECAALFERWKALHPDGVY